MIFFAQPLLRIPVVAKDACARKETDTCFVAASTGWSDQTSNSHAGSRRRSEAWPGFGAAAIGRRAAESAGDSISFESRRRCQNGGCETAPQARRMLGTPRKSENKRNHHRGVAHAVTKRIPVMGEQRE